MRSCWFVVLLASLAAMAQTATPPATAERPGVEVLSDTKGVNFEPYLKQVISVVRQNWTNMIPEAAMPPKFKRGQVAIEFAIKKDGQIAGMRLVSGSGDVSLDRASWAAITASNPFRPLPEQFEGKYLALRFHFYYNPPKDPKPETGTTEPPKTNQSGH